MKVDLVLDSIQQKEGYVVLLEKDEDVTESMIELLHSQNVIPEGGYLTVKSYNPQDKLFTISIIQSFVNRIGVPVTQNGMMIVGELPVIKEVFMQLNKKYKGE